jgi:hypothetical protein
LAGSAQLTAANFGRIELTRSGGALADGPVLDRALDGRGRQMAIIRAAATSDGTFQPPQAENKLIAEATMPRPGAASGIVPKNGIGIAFWITGVPFGRRGA